MPREKRPNLRTAPDPGKVKALFDEINKKDPNLQKIEELRDDPKSLPFTALHLAAMAEGPEILKLFLEKLVPEIIKEPLDNPKSLPFTAFHLAAMAEDPKILKLFLEKLTPDSFYPDLFDKTVDLLDHKGNTPLVYAFIGKKITNMELLIEKGANLTYLENYIKNIDSNSLFENEPSFYKEFCVFLTNLYEKFALEEIPKLEYKIFIAQQTMAITKILGYLKYNFNPGLREEIAELKKKPELKRNIKKEKLEDLFKKALLTDLGAASNLLGTEDLDWPTKILDCDIEQENINQKIDNLYNEKNSLSQPIDYNRTNALNIACQNLNLELATQLLELGADPNQRDGCGETPLTRLFLNAPQDFNIANDIATLLLAKGADPQISSNFRKSDLANPRMIPCDILNENIKNSKNESDKDGFEKLLEILKTPTLRKRKNEQIEAYIDYEIELRDYLNDLIIHNPGDLPQYQKLFDRFSGLYNIFNPNFKEKIHIDLDFSITEKKNELYLELSELAKQPKAAAIDTKTKFIRNIMARLEALENKTLDFSQSPNILKDARNRYLDIREKKLASWANDAKKHGKNFAILLKMFSEEAGEDTENPKQIYNLTYGEHGKTLLHFCSSGNEEGQTGAYLVSAITDILNLVPSSKIKEYMEKKYKGQTAFELALKPPKAAHMEEQFREQFPFLNPNPDTMHSHPGIMLELIRHGQNHEVNFNGVEAENFVNLTDRYGYNVLHTILLERHVELAQFAINYFSTKQLDEMRAKQDGQGKTPAIRAAESMALKGPISLDDAAKEKLTNCLKILLIESSISSPPKISHPLEWIIEEFSAEQNVDEVKAIIKQKLEKEKQQIDEKNQENQSILDFLVLKNQEAIFEIILEIYYPVESLLDSIKDEIPPDFDSTKKSIASEKADIESKISDKEKEKESLLEPSLKDKIADRDTLKELIKKNSPSREHQVQFLISLQNELSQIKKNLKQDDKFIKIKETKKSILILKNQIEEQNENLENLTHTHLLAYKILFEKYNGYLENLNFWLIAISKYKKTIPNLTNNIQILPIIEKNIAKIQNGLSLINEKKSELIAEVKLLVTDILIKENFDLLRKIIEMRIDELCISAREGNLLHLAVQNQWVDSINTLLKSGADPFKKDEEGKTTFDYLNNNSSEIKNILENFVDASNLRLAIKKNQTERAIKFISSSIWGAEAFRQLVENKDEDNDSEQTTLLINAVKNDNFEIVEALIVRFKRCFSEECPDETANFVNQTDEKGQSALNYALKGASTNIINLLEENGAKFTSSSAAVRRPAPISSRKGSSQFFSPSPSSSSSSSSSAEPRDPTTSSSSSSSSTASSSSSFSSSG